MLRGDVMQLVWVLCCVCLASADEDCVLPKEATVEIRLRNDIFCKYDRFQRPRPELASPFNVTLQLLMKYIDVFEHHDVVTLTAWLHVHWNDTFTKWRPSEYENLSQIIVPSSSLWVPDLYVFNSALTHNLYLEDCTCTVQYTGQVKCVPNIKAVLVCSAKLDAWPYDTQECSLVIGSWMSAYNISLMSLDTNYDWFTKNPHWKLEHPPLITEHLNLQNKAYTHLEYTFTLRRQAAMAAASYVAPAFVMSVLTLSSFWVKRGLTRVLLCCVSAIVDAIFLHNLGFSLPGNSESAPNIVLFYRDSMLLALFALLMALLVHAAGQSSQEAPGWVSSSATWLLTTRCTEPLVAGVKVEEPASQDELMPPRVRQEPPWRVFASLLDRLAFLAQLATHLVLLAALMP